MAIRVPISWTAIARRLGTGCLPDRVDLRDIHIGAVGLPTTPPDVCLPRHGLMPLYQEGNSCTGRIVQAFRIGEVNHGRECPELSGLHNYWLSRWLWGGQNRDSGSTIRDAVKALVAHGAATSAAWPESVWKVQSKPSAAAQRTAHKLRGLRGYYRLDQRNHTEIRQVLASGFAVFGGWRVNREFTNAGGPRTIDAIRSPDIALGHAWIIDGYDRERYHMMNSWLNWRGTEHSPSSAWMTRAFAAQAIDMWAIIVN